MIVMVLFNPGYFMILWQWEGGDGSTVTGLQQWE